MEFPPVDSIEWKDAVTLPGFIYSLVEKTKSEVGTQTVPLRELMQKPEFQIIVGWKGLSEVRRLYEQESERQKSATKPRS